MEDAPEVHAGGTNDNAEADTAAWLNAVATMSSAEARLLLPPGRDVNVRGAGGETALHILARHDYKLTGITALLLDGADPHAVDDQGRTPLRVAQELNQAHAVRYLIVHDELLRALTVRHGREPLLPEIVTMMNDECMEAFWEQVRLRVARISDELVTAARNGDLNAVRSIVESGEITVDAGDLWHGEMAFSAALGAGHRLVCVILSIAVTQRNVEFVRRLVTHGASTAPYEHTCPLAEAMKLGSIEMVDTLLALGARVSYSACDLDSEDLPSSDAACHSWSDPEDETPWWLLEMACWLQDTRMMDHLFATFDVLTSRAMMARHGALALFLAVYQDNADIVVDLLDRSVSINQIGNCDLTAMFAAVAVNSVDMLQLLLDRGEDTSAVYHNVDGEDRFPQGLLKFAIEVDSMDCAYKLLNMETRPQYLDEALALATWYGDVEYVGANLDVAFPSTIEALHAACSTDYPLVLDELLSRCCAERFNICDLDQSFTHACRYSDTDLVSVFLAHGFDVSHDNIGPDSPLAIALQGNDTFGEDVARLLAESGVDVAYTKR